MERITDMGRLLVFWLIIMPITVGFMLFSGIGESWDSEEKGNE